jgi:predicted small secreted protein
VPGSRLLCLLLAACALTLAACGGGDGGGGDDGGARYVEQVNKAQQDFAARVDELSKGITATSSEARDRRTLASFEQAVDEVGGDLRAIKPPGRVRGLHDQLVTAVDGYGVDVEEAADALSSRSPERLRRAQRDLAQATSAFGTTLNRTIDEINRELSS